MAKSKKNVLVCLRCGSTKVIPHQEGRHRIKHGDPLEALYTRRMCTKCGYLGNFFPEVPQNKLRQVRKEIKKLRENG